jgi:hypothetical protein
VLPFWATLQRQVSGIFTADVSIQYTEAELTRAGIPPASAGESGLVLAKFVPGACAVGSATCSENGDCGANGPCNGATYTLLPTTIDTGSHTATAAVTSFSTFAVMHPNVIAGGPVLPLVPGGGNRRTDCHAEWEPVNATNVPFLKRGFVNANQLCADGDPNCDRDRTANGTCTFQVAVCLNQTDASLPDCTPTTTASVHVTLGRKPADVANADDLLNALAALGGTRTGDKLDDVEYAAPLGASVCTPFATIEVPVGGKQRLRLRAMSATGERDGDRIRLTCQ